MLNALAKIFGSKRQSGSLAKSRLHFVLVQDRAGLTNEEMSSFRKELVEVIERYFMIDEQGFDIDYEREGEATTLVINSPVVVRRQEGVGGNVGARHLKKGKTRRERKAANQAAANA